jgi:hypothetical protein
MKEPSKPTPTFPDESESYNYTRWDILKDRLFTVLALVASVALFTIPFLAFARAFGWW